MKSQLCPLLYQQKLYFSELAEYLVIRIVHIMGMQNSLVQTYYLRNINYSALILTKYRDFL